MNKLRKILEDFITEDDKKRKRVEYNLTESIDRYEKKIRNLKLKDITAVVIMFLLLVTTQPCQAVTKCYKDICVGDRVLVIGGLYKGNYARILDVIKERTPDDDNEQIIDYYKYYVSFTDGTVLELYRDQLK